MEIIWQPLSSELFETNWTFFFCLFLSCLFVVFKIVDWAIMEIWCCSTDKCTDKTLLFCPQTPLVASWLLLIILRCPYCFSLNILSAMCTRMNKLRVQRLCWVCWSCISSALCSWRRRCAALFSWRYSTVRPSTHLSKVLWMFQTDTVFSRE